MKRLTIDITKDEDRDLQEVMRRGRWRTQAQTVRELIKLGLERLPEMRLSATPSEKERQW